MLRHYLPSIAATFALVLAIIFVPIGNNLTSENGGEIKTSVVSAQTVQHGDGLTGKYYQIWNCTGVSKTQIDPVIDFKDDSKFGVGYHDPCIIWSGQIYIEGATGNYTFYLAHDDSAKLRVDNTLIYDQQDWNPNDRPSQEIHLESKRRYDITLEFYDLGWLGYVTLKWSGPGMTKEVVPQRVLYSTRTACSDGIDNDGDGKIDWPDDPGCTSAHSDRESECGNNLFEPHNLEVCDGTDLGGKTCITETGPGQLGELRCASDCKSFDTSQCSAPPPKPACSDGIDNDGDGKIDFPHDPGCSSPDDDDETDPPPPPINRNITFTKQVKPQVIIQPLLAEREILSFPAPCSTCTVTTTPDHTQFVGGTPLANDGFVVVAKSVDSKDNSVSYTIVAVGNFEENTQLFTSDGRQYIHNLR